MSGFLRRFVRFRFAVFCSFRPSNRFVDHVVVIAVFAHALIDTAVFENRQNRTLRAFRMRIVFCGYFDSGKSPICGAIHSSMRAFSASVSSCHSLIIFSFTCEMLPLPITVSRSTCNERGARSFSRSQFRSISVFAQIRKTADFLRNLQRAFTDF